MRQRKNKLSVLIAVILQQKRLIHSIVGRKKRIEKVELFVT